MNNTAFVTGADRGLGLALADELANRNWMVAAGHLDENPESLFAVANAHRGKVFPVRIDISDEESVKSAAKNVSGMIDRIDLLINNAGVLGVDGYEKTIREGLNYREIAGTINVNATGPLRVVQYLLPIMADSELKRLCFVSSEAGSITRSHREAWFGYCMSKTALNMGISILYNDLRKEGYTFRVYHPGWMRTFMMGVKSVDAHLEPEEAAAFALKYFLEDAVDEDILVMRDNEGITWPW